jgi:hypothetical protein
MSKMQYKTIKHNDRQVSAELRSALEAQTEKYLSGLQARNQPLLTHDERNVLFNKQLALYKSIATPLGIDIDKFVSGLKDISAEKQEKISAARQTRNMKLRDRSPATHIPSRPAPFPRFFLLYDVTMFAVVDHPHLPDDTVRFEEDALGQHFVGEFVVRDWNSELHASFGMAVRFRLPAADLPEPVPGGYTSTPTLFINGQLETFCPGGDVFQGRGVASGDLILSQSIYQWGFGADGPVPISIGQGSFNVASQHFDQEDADAGVLLPPMPGSVEMPTVQIPSFIPEDIWVTLEVYIQCYLKSQAATLNTYQPIQMLIPEWPIFRAT